MANCICSDFVAEPTKVHGIHGIQVNVEDGAGGPLIILEILACHMCEHTEDPASEEEAHFAFAFTPGSALGTAAQLTGGAIFVPNEGGRVVIETSLTEHGDHYDAILTEDGEFAKPPEEE